MVDDIVTRLRCPAERCICVNAVLVNCVPCNTRLDAANAIEARDTEIERLRAERDELAHLAVEIARLRFAGDRLAAAYEAETQPQDDRQWAISLAWDEARRG